MKLPPNKIKIVAAIGPAFSSLRMLEQTICAGMKVARLNFSHDEYDTHCQNMENRRDGSRPAGCLHGGFVRSQNAHWRSRNE